MVQQKRYQRLLRLKTSKYNYKSLMSEKTFLKVQKRARGIGVDLVSIDYEGMELRFRTQSTTIKGKYYTEIIQLSSLQPEDIIKGKNLAEVLRSAKIKIYSSDPAFLFWGTAFWSWKQGFGLYPERRFPRVRNPHHRMYVSKHMYAVLMTFPFLAGQIGKYLKKYWTEKQQKEFQEQMDKVVKDIKLEDLIDA